MKKVINFNTDGRYDVDMTETNIEFNASFSPKEKSTEQFLNNIFNSTIECKAQNSSRSSFFVEYGMAIPGKDWKEEFRPHGILTTESEHYCVNIGTGLGFFVETDYLLWLYRNNKVKRNIKDTSKENDIGIGLIVYYSEFVELYQEYLRDRRLKELGLRK